MVFLTIEMWAALLAFFLLGLWARGFLARPAAEVAGEDATAELAMVRTRHQESEADRARLKARAAELNMQLADARGELETVQARLADLEQIHAGAKDDAGDGAALRTRMVALEKELETVKERAAEADAIEAELKQTRTRAEAAEREAARVDPLTARIAELEARGTAAPVGGTDAAFEDDAMALRARVRVLEEELETAFAAPTGGVAADLEDDAAALRAQLLALQTQLDDASEAARDAKPEPKAAPEASPTFLDGPTHGDPDDLKQIKGIGPKLETLLHDEGVFYFWQIAAWNADQVAEVNAKIQFPGRIERDAWVKQAAEFAS